VGGGVHDLHGVEDLTEVANAEVASVRMKLKLTREEHLYAWIHFGEALREVGVLWIVFASLDRFVAGTVTFPWILWNGLASIAVWSFGLYIGIRTR
jgi:hypothetical protein